MKKASFCSSLDEIKCKWIIVNHSCGLFEGLGWTWGVFLFFCFSNLAAILVCNTRGKVCLIIFTCSTVLGVTASLGTGRSCLIYIASLSWACTTLEKISPPVLIPVCESSPWPRRGWRVKLKCIMRAVSRGDGPAGRRGRHGPSSISLQHIGMVSVLLRTVLLFTFLNNFLSWESKKEKMVFFPSCIGATFFNYKNIWWPFDECLP